MTPQYITFIACMWQKKAILESAYRTVPPKYRPNTEPQTKAELIDAINTARQRYWDDMPRDTQGRKVNTGAPIPSGAITATEVDAFLAELPPKVPE